mmetsp:Transcript_13399/g.38620  ORF Transcript_13399/g.38620 Transcript_13399/m.38620 type:complete len:216 (+) Transcript_13399:201-848(+)
MHQDKQGPLLAALPGRAARESHRCRENPLDRRRQRQCGAVRGMHQVEAREWDVQHPLAKHKHGRLWDSCVHRQDAGGPAAHAGAGRLPALRIHTDTQMQTTPGARRDHPEKTRSSTLRPPDGRHQQTDRGGPILSVFDSLPDRRPSPLRTLPPAVSAAADRALLRHRPQQMGHFAADPGAARPCGRHPVAHPAVLGGVVQARRSKSQHQQPGECG